MLEHLPDSLPFVAASTSAAANARGVSVQRVIEAIIIGIIAAAGSTYVMVKVLDERVTEISRRIDRIEANADARVGALQEDVRRIYGLLVQERQARRTDR